MTSSNVVRIVATISMCSLATVPISAATVPAALVQMYQSHPDFDSTVTLYGIA